MRTAPFVELMTWFELKRGNLDAAEDGLVAGCLRLRRVDVLLSFYRVRVSADEDELARLGDQRLVPGMPPRKPLHKTPGKHPHSGHANHVYEERPQVDKS